MFVPLKSDFHSLCWLILRKATKLTAPLLYPVAGRQASRIVSVSLREAKPGGRRYHPEKVPDPFFSGIPSGWTHHPRYRVCILLSSNSGERTFRVIDTSPWRCPQASPQRAHDGHRRDGFGGNNVLYCSLIDWSQKIALSETRKTNP